MNLLDHELVFNYFPQLTERQKTQFKQLKELYLFWNEKINVISRKDIDSLYEKHILHSLAIAKVISFAPKTLVLDIGTGGGFPGIPLAILFPEVQFTLVDSIAKKIKVVEEVVTAINLQNTLVKNARVENLTTTYHFAVTRAVAPMQELQKWLSKKIAKQSFNTLKNGIIALKGGDLTEEMKHYKLSQYKIIDIKKFFESNFFEEKKVVVLPIE